MNPRRLVDGAIAFSVLALTAPLLLVLAVWIRLDSPGPALYRARRVGKHGKLFDMLKLRSMVMGAVGPGLTVATDGRITRCGRILRRSKLDELPQLWNVVRGEMALVGPRPEDPRYIARLSEEQKRVLEYTPGVISPASLKYHNEQELLASAPDSESHYLDVILPDKLAIDMDYLSRRQTAGRDIALLIRAGLQLLRITRPQQP